MSEKLNDQKEKIDGFIAEQQANLEDHENRILPKLREQFKQASKKYDSYTDWWLKKAWYKFWDEKKLTDLKNERDSYGERISTTETLIASMKESIKNLQDAQKWTDEHSQKAKALELSIEKLKTEVDLAQQDQVHQVRQYEAQRALAKENSDRDDEAHKADMAGLAKDIEEQKVELSRLQDGTHDLHVELKDKKESMQSVIAKHEEAILGLEAQIKAYALEIEEAEQSRERGKKDYEDKLTKLQKHIADLEADVVKEQEALSLGKKELERIIREGHANIENLKKELLAAIATLKERITENHARMLNQKEVNEEVILSSQAKFRESVDGISRQIEDFTSAKQESLQALDELRKVHGEAPTDAIVSETLHKAKVDLEFKLKLETNARDTAVTNLHNMGVERARLSAEIQSLDKWYKGWYHRLISKKLPRLERNLNFLRIEIDEETKRRDRYIELIGQLSAQIKSKLNATQLAEGEEAALEELEKQITDKRGEKKKEIEANNEALRLEKEAGDEAIETLQDHEATLKAKEHDANEELRALEDGTHDDHAALKMAKAEMNDVLETREEAIQRLSGVITVAKHDEQELIENQQRVDAEHAKAITDLNKLKQGLNNQTHSQEVQKKAQAAALKDFESDHNERIEDERAFVAEGIQDLQQFKEAQEDAHGNAKIALRDVQQLQEREHQEDIERLKADIKSMKVSKSETAELLKEIEDENPHGA